jgi:predicted N-acyltransferase
MERVVSSTPFLSLPTVSWSRRLTLPTLRTLVLNSIRDIDAARWNALVGGHAVTRSHAYFDALEHARINDCRYYYPLVLDERDAIVAQACVYTITTDFAQLLPGVFKPWVAAVRRLWPRFLRAKVTECAAPMVAGHSVALSGELDPAPLIDALERAVAEIARQAGSPLIVWRDFLSAERRTFDRLLKRGYRLRLNMPLARIRVRWPDYASYVGAMRARYRKDVKRRLERAAAHGQHVLRISDFGADAELWAGQAAVVRDHAERFKRETVTAEYYRALATHLGEASTLLVASRDGRQVAHGMVLADEETTVATFFGREAGRPHAEWFSLMNEAIRFGIERGSRYIHLGLGSYDAKNLVGADIEPLFVYCRTRYRVINWLMSLVPEIMAERSLPRRRIFHD